MTLFEECAARLARDIDFLERDAAGRLSDAESMMEIFDLPTDPASIRRMVALATGQGEAPEAVDPFSDAEIPEPAEEAPTASDGPQPWLTRFKDATRWLNDDLGELLGVKGVTVQAYTAGRIPERFDRRQKDTLRRLCDVVAKEVTALKAEL